MQAKLNATWNNDPINIQKAWGNYYAILQKELDQGCWCDDCQCSKTVGYGENPNQAICDLIERLMEKGN